MKPLRRRSKFLPPDAIRVYCLRCPWCHRSNAVEAKRLVPAGPCSGCGRVHRRSFYYFFCWRCERTFDVEVEKVERLKSRGNLSC